MFVFELSLTESFINSTEKHLSTFGNFVNGDINLEGTSERIGKMQMRIDSSNAVSDLKASPTLQQAVKRKQHVAPKLPRKESKAAEMDSKSALNPSLIRKASVDVDSMLNISKNVKSGEKIFQCSFCGYSSAFRQSAKRHIQLKHLPKNEVFKCQLCEHCCNLKFNLKLHYTSKHSLPEIAAKAMLEGV